MTLESRFFEFNGINLTQFTDRIKDSQNTSPGDMPILGSEQRVFGQESHGLRTILWSGYISNSDIYTRLRKELFDDSEKIIKLSHDRYITLKSVSAERDLFIKKSEDNKMTMVMVAVDTREYSVTRSSIEQTIIASPTTIGLESKGTAKTVPGWIIKAVGTIINPTISEGEDEMTWSGTLTAGKELSISREGTTKVDGMDSNSIIGDVLKAGHGETQFIYSDDPNSSHNCTVKAVWNDAYY